MKHRDRGETVIEPQPVFGPKYRSATYDSILEIDNVRTEHYNTLFRCEVENEYGATSHDIEVRCIDTWARASYNGYIKTF